MFAFLLSVGVPAWRPNDLARSPRCCSSQGRGFGTPRLPKSPGNGSSGKSNAESGETRRDAGDSLSPDGSGTQSGSGGRKEIGFVGSDEMGIAFTCGVCDTRVAKSIKRQSYEKGVCLVQCPGCSKYHVIADNLGMYSAITDGKKNVEEMARGAGEKFTRVESSVFDLEKLVAKQAEEVSEQEDLDSKTA